MKGVKRERTSKEDWQLTNRRVLHVSHYNITFKEFKEWFTAAVRPPIGSPFLFTDTSGFTPIVYTAWGERCSDNRVQKPPGCTGRFWSRSWQTRRLHLFCMLMLGAGQKRCYHRSTWRDKNSNLISWLLASYAKLGRNKYPTTEILCSFPLTYISLHHV